MNLKLKQALAGHKAYRVAMAAGIYHSTLSKIVSEIQKPTPEQKKRLAEVLGKTVGELFNEEEANQK